MPPLFDTIVIYARREYFYRNRNKSSMAIGRLFNFHEVKLVDGISRLVLPGANKSCTEENEGNEV
jgi:hypothetical protein